MNPAVSFAIVTALEILLFAAQAARVHLPAGSGSSKAVVAYQNWDAGFMPRLLFLWPACLVAGRALFGL